MKKRILLPLGLLILLSAAILLPLRAEEADSYVYTYEGKANIVRDGKAKDLRLDMPIKNGDLFKVEPDSWIDYAFFNTIGLRLAGPSEITARSVTSLSNIEIRTIGGTALIHTENAGDPFLLSLDTPLAVIRVMEPTLAHLSIEPRDAKGKPGKMKVVVKKGRMDVVVKLSDASVRVLENQKVEIDADTFIPPAYGTLDEDLKPAERARTVYVPKKGGQEESDDF